MRTPVFAFLLLAATAAPAGAASITYLSDSRSVGTSYSAYDSEYGPTGDGSSQDAPVQGQSWSSTWTAPWLVSTFAPTDITLELSVRRGTYTSNTFPFYGDFTRTISYSGPQDIAVARIRFSVSDPTPSVWTRDGVQWTQDLLPGVVYLIDERLASQTNAGPDVVTRFFSVTLVPEPGTAALLALGIAALARRGARLRS